MHHPFIWHFYTAVSDQSDTYQVTWHSSWQQKYWGIITRSCTWNKTNHKYHMRSQRYGFAQWANDHSFLLLGQHLQLQLRLRFIAPALCTPDGRWDVPIESLEQPNHQTLGAITLLSASLGVRQRGFQVGTLNGFLSLSCFYLLRTRKNQYCCIFYYQLSQYPAL